MNEADAQTRAERLTALQALAQHGEVRPILETPVQRTSFARWLLDQGKRTEWWATLALAAQADRQFPKNADPDEVRRRLQLLGGDADMFEMLEDAERVWRAE